MQRRLPLIADVRGLGALVGVELHAANQASASQITRDIITMARERGLLLLAGGTHGNVLRLLPPLTIGTEKLQAALSILDGCLSDFA